MVVVTPNGDWCAIDSEGDLSFIDDTGWSDEDYELMNGWTQFRLLDYAYNISIGVLPQDMSPCAYERALRE